MRKLRLSRAPDLHGMFGGAGGILSSLSPSAKVIVALSLFAAIMIAPGQHPGGMLLSTIVTIIYMAAARPPKVKIANLLKLVLVIYLPMMIIFVVFQFIDAVAEGQRVVFGQAGTGTLVSIAVKGAAGVLVAGTACSTLSIQELSDALRSLPLPGVLTTLVLLILQQSSVMVGEAVRTGQALAVRGLLHSRTTRFQIVRNLPSVYLPRIFAKSERVTRAMDVRGFGDSYSIPPGRRFRSRDLPLAAASILPVLISILLYWR